MKKFIKLCAVFAALGMMSSCSSDEPAADNGGQLPGTGGDKAYMSIKISDTGDMGLLGRSTDFDTPAYTDGDSNEHLVKNAKFFFFDENGNYVMSASLANPDFGTDGPNDNIEWVGNTNVLVLEDLTAQNYPTYMLTVLNMPAFEAAATLDATSKKLSVYAENLGAGENGINADASKFNFVMTTSSYKGTTNYHVDKYYSVNKLDTSNFCTTPEAALQTSPVNVYIERLAAKVQVSVNATKADNGLYELAQTVAGDPNDNNDPLNPGTTTNTKLYLRIDGWSVNAYAQESYMSKQLLDTWTETSTTPFANWNAADRYRSFWAYSVPYAADANAADKLNFIHPNALNGQTTNDNPDYAQYVYENTNTADNVAQTNAAGQTVVHNDRVTHVVLKATVCDENGAALDMVNFRGTLFLTKTFKAYALNALKNSIEGLNYYKKTGSTDTSADYTQVSVDDIALQGVTGHLDQATVVVTYTGDLYAKSTNESGDHYTKIDSPDLQTRLNGLANGLPINWYKGGASVYYIPIEHNATAANKGKEGYYGVVRNHWYKLNITSFSRVGHAVFDPESGTEVLKPETPEDPLYYVGAKINILSWRVISQNVDL